MNEVLKEKKTSVEACKKTVDLWQSRVQLVLDAVKSLSQKLDDGQLSDNEVSFTETLFKKNLDCVSYFVP